MDSLLEASLPLDEILMKKSYCGQLEDKRQLLWASWDVCGRLSALCFLLAHFPWSCVHSTWTQRQRLSLSMMSAGFSLSVSLTSLPQAPLTKTTTFLPPQISFPLISAQPSFVFTAQICCNTRDQSGGWFTGRSSQRLLTPDSRQDASPGWLCCSPRSCLPHWRVRRLILTKFLPTWNLVSRVQKPRKVIFRMY